MNFFSHKFALFSLAFLITASTQYPKAAQYPIVKITFAAQHVPSMDARNIDSEVDYQYCLDSLKSLSEIQKTRKLSLEEMLHVFKIVNFMIKQYDQDAKKIEVSLSGCYTIVLPYSVCAYLDMMMQTQGQDHDEDDDQDENQ